MEIRFRVFGLPKPGGSKKAFVIRGTNKAAVVEASNNKEWRADVRSACQSAYNGPLLDGPLFMRIVFLLPRPKSHFGTGKKAGDIKGSAPFYPMKKPDLTKLIRSTEDALTNVLWRDDTQIIMQVVIKKYTNDTPGADILVCPMHPGLEWKCFDS